MPHRQNRFYITRNFVLYNVNILWIVGLMLIFAAIFAVNTQSQNSKTDESPSAHAAQEIQVRGKVVCLPEEMHKLYHSDLPLNHEHIYGFKTEDGTFYTLLRTNMSEALFVDKRLHEKVLLITGRTFPKTQILEVMNLQSIHNGTLHDLYYYCETCAIKAYVPGNCVCCQEPVELVEKPVETK